MAEHTSCQDIQGFGHESVKHSIGEYMKNQAHTNGVESLCTMLKHAHNEVFYKISMKHLAQHVVEFLNLHNLRPLDTQKPMRHIVNDLSGHRLRCKDLVA